MPRPGPALFYRPGGLGDLLTTLPAMRLARRARPGVPILLAASGEAGRLAARILGAEFVSVDDPALSALFRGESSSASIRLGPAGLEPDSFLAWLVKEPAPEMRAASGRLFGDRGRIHVYEPDSGLPISRFFYERTAAGFGLAASDAEFEAPARLPDFGPPPFVLPAKPFIVVHPGSGSPRKNWPFEGFLTVIRTLAGRGLDGFLVLGPAESDLAPPPGEADLLPGWRVLREPPLPALASVLARCSGFLGNDSGVTHLAAAAGAAVVALFRDANLPAWRPYGRCVVLRAPEAAAIAPADVLAALDRFPAPSAIQYPA